MRHPFSIDALATYLRQHLAGFGGELSAQQFSSASTAASLR